MAVLDPVTTDRIREVATALGKRAQVQGVYVYGSRVEGTADQWSDLDIAVFLHGLENWDYGDHIRAITDVQRKLGDDLDIHLFKADQLRNAPKASFAAHVLKHGINVPLD